MNIIGKILVILNLIFALVVGGFLVIDFAARNDWKKNYEDLKREIDVTRKNTDASSDTLTKLNNEVKRVRAEADKLKQDLIDQELLSKAQLESQKQKTQEEIDRAKEADLNTQKAIAEVNRLKEENKALTETVQTRDKTVLALQDDNKKFRAEAIAQEAVAKQTQARNESLLEQIQDLLRRLRLREAGVAEGSLIRDPNAPNPPSTYVQGRIEKIDPKDRTYVQISLGSDQGLKLNHTLEVFRLGADAQYLGRIRIVDAKEHTSLGRLERGSTSSNRILAVGDIVASSIMPPAR
jgi:hypothetical protein